MCGIGGIVRFDDRPMDRPIDRPRLDAMLAALRHRGPDGEGIAQLGRCALVHARLSIIDLLSGAQPMHLSRSHTQGPLTLVFNGEVYNHRALRRLLETRGHTFHSDHSDTEVILFGYREWGPELPKHLHGMFALAIWDEDARSLFLCRDRAGKKPLWYTQTPGRELRFSSLVASLVAGRESGESTGVDQSALLRYLRFGYTDDRSLVAGVQELPAAHWALIDARGSMRVERYWQPPPISRTSTKMGAAAALRELLTEAVAQRMEADVPLGCFLSGGIDSSVIAAMAQHQCRERGGEPLHTFCVSMPSVRYDESDAADAVAKHLGTRHTTLRVDDSLDVAGDLERLITLSGEPTADSSLLPTYWVSRLTREHVAVALSGEGGDELFGGYDRYRVMPWLTTHRHLMQVLPVVGSVLDPRGTGARLRRLRYAAGVEEAAQQYRRLVELFSDDQIRAMGLEPVGEAMHDWPQEPLAVHAAMRWDLSHYLAHDLLRKVDRASMAVALEVRCPMLDTQLCDLAGHLPARVLMPRNRPKALLREIAKPLLPAAIVRRGKRGFAVPIGAWFRGSLKSVLADRLTGPELATLGLDRRAISRWFDEHMAGRVDHSHRLFGLWSLAIWTKAFTAPR